MEATAIATGGRFFKVDDPNKLPAIFIREARRISRSLIQEGVSVTPSMQRGLVGGPLDGLSVASSSSRLGADWHSGGHGEFGGWA